MNEKVDILPILRETQNGICVEVGKQPYALPVSKEQFRRSFNDGLRHIHLNEHSPGGMEPSQGFSQAELREIKQQIITEAIRFRGPG